MTAKILTFWHWVVAKFRRQRPLPIVVEVPLLPVVTPDPEPITEGALALQPAPEPKPIPQKVPTIEWHFRSTILDRLDEYFVCMRNLRRIDPDSYGLFSRTGFAVSADAYPDPQTWPDRLKTIPHVTFGGILCGGFADIPKMDCQPSFVYFHKLDHPARVERHAGDIYRLTILYDDRKKARHWGVKLQAALICHLALDAGGQMTVLKERRTERSSFTHKRKDGRKEEIFTTGTSWAYPAWMTDVARDPNDPEPFWLARFLFGMSLLTYGEVTERIIVRATHEQVVAAFAIALPCAKRFFADRCTELAVDGKRKRIFHSVVEHERQLATKTVTVRAHYRGERSFSWQQYRIHIVLPKNSSLLQFDAPVNYAADLPNVERHRQLTEAQTGQVFADLLAQ